LVPASPGASVGAASGVRSSSDCATLFSPASAFVADAGVLQLLHFGLNFGAGLGQLVGDTLHGVVCCTHDDRSNSLVQAVEDP
jgi:hypothetical protein